jgi:hypothetical protein
MAKTTRRKIDPALKAKIALEASGRPHERQRHAGSRLQSPGYRFATLATLAKIEQAQMNRSSSDLCDLLSRTSEACPLERGVNLGRQTSW